MKALAAAAHELRCAQCRVTWYSWALRLLHLGGMAPMNPGWRKMPVAIDFGDTIGSDL